MKSARRIPALALLVAIVYVFQTSAQETQRTARPSDPDEQQTGGTMRPVIRGAHAAVSSMKPEATRAAENILRAGGNAFDAAVAGQAVLALVDPASKLAKYPTSKKVYQSKRYTEGELFKNPDLARTLRKLVETERQNTSKGRHAALKAARDRFYKGDIAQTMAKFSEENGGLFRYEDFTNYTAKVERSEERRVGKERRTQWTQ